MQLLQLGQTATATLLGLCVSNGLQDRPSHLLVFPSASANTKDRCCFHHHRTRQENGRPTNQQPWLHKSFLSAKDLTRLTPKGGQDLSPTFQGPKVKKCHQQDLNLRQLRLRPEHSALDHSAIVTLPLSRMNFK
jgi:hypothetical protein